MRDIRPPRLRPGDRVAVVAPSGPVPADRLDRGCDRLRKAGFEVTLGAHVLARHGYLAGTDAQRAADLTSAWCDDDVRAVLCARGGYGALRLLDHLDPARFAAARPKPLLGSSDVTVLHRWLARHAPVTTLYGPMVAGRALGSDALGPRWAEQLISVLTAPDRSRLLHSPHARELVAGLATGPVVGGNLNLLAALLGTTEVGSADGCVVLLEDVNKESHRLDRLFTQLLRARWFDGAVGVVVGSWQNCGEDADAILLERLGPLGIPVLTGFDVGHGPRQLTVPLGVPAVLDTASRSLHYPRPALR
ncbi:S66 peptidase family protein [Cryptosporangium arvum]|uniref:Putative MccF-like protein (Microcin C7 resistance) n=1 Tax=Cryptosporangium arvum DSM 44712 TaxID=927661 RepID=A0A010Z5I4_9ACTN|nr:LD-carboxypeptidase [Cryptosporangium arvum]EXG82608.1 putative MccF-like protein (microcin C7 resistance) [Cryptosporangium arvum DSM 44712]